MSAIKLLCEQLPFYLNAKPTVDKLDAEFWSSTSNLFSDCLMNHMKLAADCGNTACITCVFCNLDHAGVRVIRKNAIDTVTDVEKENAIHQQMLFYLEGSPRPKIEDSGCRLLCIGIEPACSLDDLCSDCIWCNESDQARIEMSNLILLTKAIGG